MRKNEIATDLIGVYKNFELTNLDQNSSFYVDVDVARDGIGGTSVREQILFDYRLCSSENDSMDDEYKYERQLFIGHKACGKTTELHKIEYELKDKYFTIYISDIEKSEDRISSQADFLYFVIQKILEVCEKNEKLYNAIKDDIDILSSYLREKIFGEVIEEFNSNTLRQRDAGVEVSAGIRAPVFGFLAKLGARSQFAETTNEKLTISIKNNFSEFIEISNQIIMKIQSELRKDGKMLLLILDGLDKIKESAAEEIFLGTQSFLTQLNCSMIVTFPIYLLYSSKKNQAIAPFGNDKWKILSMIKVHERDGSDCESGINALMEIAKKRMDISLLENDECLKEAIRLSGGNLRDYFKFIRGSARNSYISKKDTIEKNILNKVYNEVKSGYHRQLTEAYMPRLEELYFDKRKTSLIRESPQDDILLNMFESGLLIEYNGERWCDLHPLVKEIVAERIRIKKENADD